MAEYSLELTYLIVLDHAEGAGLAAHGLRHLAAAHGPPCPPNSYFVCSDLLTLPTRFRLTSSDTSKVWAKLKAHLRWPKLYKRSLFIA